MNSSLYAIGFRTLADEIHIDAVPVRGTIPAWLNGTLLRTGPARFEVGRQAYNHWFDGLAMLHKFSFAGGRVAYANRFLHSHSYAEAMTHGKISRSEFATDPCRTLFQRVATFVSPTFTDNGNVNIQQLGGEVVALIESPLPIRFDPETLQTLGGYTYKGGLHGQLSIAHPHFDHQRQCHYSYLLEFGRHSRYHLYSVAADTGQQALVGSVVTEKPAYMHSFGMTEHYLILTEFPLVVHPLALRFRGKPFIRNYRWEPERGTRFHIVDKQTGGIVKSAHAAPFFGFHHVNAFERDGEVIVDLITYPDVTVIDHLYLDRLRSQQPVTSTGTLTRLCVSLTGSNEARHEPLAEPAIELPRIHYRSCSGRPYRYVYGAGNAIPGNFIDKLVKVDVQTQHHASWYEDGCYPGEPVFVAAPEATTEDDGVILSVVLDAKQGKSFLLVLVASDYEELARAQVPHHIPFGFHGNYFAALDGPQSTRTFHS